MEAQRPKLPIIEDQERTWQMESATSLPTAQIMGRLAALNTNLELIAYTPERRQQVAREVLHLEFELQLRAEEETWATDKQQ